jgi:bromodomain-containing factor 1
LKKPSGKGNPREEKRVQVEKERNFRYERLFHHCASVLRNVESRNRNACLFLEPVDGNLVPDYYQVIKKPMDFMTIKQRIEEKYYATPLEFALDVRQVFANCKIYNKPGSVEANMGLDVEGDFERRFANSKITEKWEQELMRRDTEDYEIANTSTVALHTPAPSSKSHKTPSKASGGARKSASHKKRSYASRTPDEFSRPMTFEEKRALSTALEQLPADKLGRVVEIIQESNALGGDDDKEELELDIDLLDPETLWKLQRYTSGSLKPLKKARKQAPSLTPHDPFVDVPQGPGDDGPESSSGSGSSTSSG